MAPELKAMARLLNVVRTLRFTIANQCVSVECVRSNRLIGCFFVTVLLPSLFQEFDLAL